MMLILVGLIYAAFVQAQSNQIKVYLQQIAANKVLIEYIRKGYKIARTGLTTIGDIRNGEFNLHRDFIGSLQIVNPKIKNASGVTDILAFQVKIIKVYQQSFKQIKRSGQFTDTEIDYIYSVFTKLLDDTAVILEELLAITSLSHFQMSDDERIKRIDRLYADIKTNYVFAQHFGNDALVLAVQRMKEKQELEKSRELHGIVPNK
ncbi:MAG: hypothetical protein H7Z13_02140 [Ferruginibacter sp.]|nr:hypothetical protein [Ferruginibacter sp.]